jgi:hypothetical protein
MPLEETTDQQKIIEAEAWRKETRKSEKGLSARLTKRVAHLNERLREIHRDKEWEKLMEFFQGKSADQLSLKDLTYGLRRMNRIHFTGPDITSEQTRSYH